MLREGAGDDNTVTTPKLPLVVQALTPPAAPSSVACPAMYEPFTTPVGGWQTLKTGLLVVVIIAKCRHRRRTPTNRLCVGTDIASSTCSRYCVSVREPCVPPWCSLGVGRGCDAFHVISARPLHLALHTPVPLLCLLLAMANDGDVTTLCWRLMADRRRRVNGTKSCLLKQAQQLANQRRSRLCRRLTSCEKKCWR